MAFVIFFTDTLAARRFTSIYTLGSASEISFTDEPAITKAVAEVSAIMEREDISSCLEATSARSGAFTTATKSFGPDVQSTVAVLPVPEV